MIMKAMGRLGLGLSLILAASAALLVTDRERLPGANRAGESRSGRNWRVGVVTYNETPLTEELLEGFREGIKESGLVEGTDYTMTVRSAQGDMATLSAIIDEFRSGDIDLLFTVATPVLQATLRKVEELPVVFSGVLDPVAAGAGKSFSEHRANVTGRALGYPYEEMIQTLHTVLPRARRVGTLYSPGEINSSVARERFLGMLKAAGVELVSIPVSSPTEVSDAALSLCQSGIDAVCQISDNLSNSSFPAIARACEGARMPLFTFSPSHVTRGAMLGVGCNFAENGREAGLVLAEVIRGGDPGRIPFATTTKVTRSVNLDTARRLGITVPREWLKTANQVIDGTAAKKPKAE